MTEQNFQVNLGGIIDILSQHLYSNETVFIRELLQNATDAIRARQLNADEDFEPKIEIELVTTEGEPSQLIVMDNGIGLTLEEVKQFVVIIGLSSKKDELQKKREEFIGQFGIGLLSCFLVTEQIVIISQSIASNKPVEWRGKSDGTYTLKELKKPYLPGTKIYISATPDGERFFTPEQITSLLKRYGELLPFPILFTHNENTVQINETKPPWMLDYYDSEEFEKDLLEFGIKHFNQPFFASIPIETSSGKTKGAAFILMKEKPSRQQESHKVYIKNMFVTQNPNNLLPEWAFFVKCIIDSENLRPNAAREALFEDNILLSTRNEIGICIKNYFFTLSRQNPPLLQKIIQIHFVAMKSIAIKDKDFFDIIFPFIPFQTNKGIMTIPNYQKQFGNLKYLTSDDEFRQIEGLATAQNIVIVNAGFVYDKEFLIALKENYPEVILEEYNASLLAQDFEELSKDEKDSVYSFSQIANAALKDFKCSILIKKFNPINIPAMYYQNSDTTYYRNLQKSKDAMPDGVWGELLTGFIEDTENSGSKLILNFNNNLIQNIIKIKTEEVLFLMIQVLYVQSLMMGHHPLNESELNVLTNGLGLLLEAHSVSN